MKQINIKVSDELFLFLVSRLSEEKVVSMPKLLKLIIQKYHDEHKTTQ